MFGLFGQKPPTPMFDFVTQVTLDSAADHAEQSERGPNDLAVVFSRVILAAANRMMTLDPGTLKAIRVHRDVLTFEATAFAAYAIQAAYWPPLDDDDDDDDDDRRDEYETYAFQLANAIVPQTLRKAGGHDLEGIFRSRFLKYRMQKRGTQAAGLFIADVMDAGKATTPMKTYPGPTSTDTRQLSALMGAANLLISAQAAVYAKALRETVEDFNLG